MDNQSKCEEKKRPTNKVPCKIHPTHLSVWTLHDQVARAKDRCSQSKSYFYLFFYNTVLQTYNMCSNVLSMLMCSELCRETFKAEKFFFLLLWSLLSRKKKKNNNNRRRSNAKTTTFQLKVEKYNLLPPLNNLNSVTVSCLLAISQLKPRLSPNVG